MQANKQGTETKNLEFAGSFDLNPHPKPIGDIFSYVTLGRKEGSFYINIRNPNSPKQV